jgi:hypothetical protein
VPVPKAFGIHKAKPRGLTREILAKLVDQVVVRLVCPGPELNHQIIVATRESTIVVTYSD